MVLLERPGRWRLCEVPVVLDAGGGGVVEGWQMTTLDPPRSKSDAQRALALAALLAPTRGASEVDLGAGPWPSDVEVLRGGLPALAQPDVDLDCRDGGAPFRFLLTQAGAVVGAYGALQRLSAPRRPPPPTVVALRQALGPRGARGGGGVPVAAGAAGAAVASHSGALRGDGRREQSVRQQPGAWGRAAGGRARRAVHGALPRTDDEHGLPRPDLSLGRAGGLHLEAQPRRGDGRGPASRRRAARGAR